MLCLNASIGLRLLSLVLIVLVLYCSFVFSFLLFFGFLLLHQFCVIVFDYTCKMIQKHRTLRCHSPVEKKAERKISSG